MLTGRKKQKGFTIIELLVVLAIISLLAGLAVQVVSSAIQKSKEAALKQNLHVMRKSIEDFLSDNGVYPKDLQELVDKKYLRKIPVDPVTESASSWILVSGETDTGEEGIADIKSGSDDKSIDGENFQEW